MNVELLNFLLLMILGTLVQAIGFYIARRNYKRYIDSCVRYIKELTSLDKRKGHNLDIAILNYLAWLRSEEVSSVLLQVLLFNPRIEQITNNSVSGIKTLSEALLPQVQEIQKLIANKLDNEYQEKITMFLMDMKAEMENESKTMVKEKI